MPYQRCLCSQPPPANRYHLAARPRWVGMTGPVILGRTSRTPLPSGLT